MCPVTEGLHFIDAPTVRVPLCELVVVRKKLLHIEVLWRRTWPEKLHKTNLEEMCDVGFRNFSVCFNFAYCVKLGNDTYIKKA